MIVLKNPEMRQHEKDIHLFASCRPSGLSGFPRESKDSTRKSLKFTIKTISDITPNGAIKRWTVRSSGRRSVLIRYLFLKFLYDELTQEEYKVFLSFPDTTSVIPIFYALRARIEGIPKKVIRKILETLTFPGFKVPTRDEYIGLKQIRFTHKIETEPPIRKPKPYSGYSKGYKDGKRRTKFQVDEFNSSPLEPSPKFEDEINILIEFSFIVISHPRKLKNFSLFTGDL